MLPDQEEDFDPGGDDDGERKEEPEDEESDVVAEVWRLLPGRGAAHPVVLNDVTSPAQEGREGQAQTEGPGEKDESQDHPPAVAGEVTLKYILCTQLSASLPSYSHWRSR